MILPDHAFFENLTLSFMPPIVRNFSSLYPEEGALDCK